jgi:hypothetical protein
MGVSDLLASITYIMKNIYIVLILTLNLGCSKPEKSNNIEGSWYQCLKNGAYQEFKINKDYMIQLTTEFEDQVSFFKSNIQDSLLIVSGINVSVINGTDTLIVIPKSSNTIVFKNRYYEFELRRLNVDIPDIDSTKFDVWKSKTLKNFKTRSDQMNCPDLRTEEEKNPIIELGVIEDDFEDLIDIDELPKWATTKYLKYEQNFERSFKLFPSFLEADFTGDGTTDIAIFVSKKSNEKKGVLFLFGDGDKMFLAGAGNSFGSGGDNFEWADYWEVFDQGISQETTFLENGDVDGSREVKLKNAAISIREDEGSGGLIYFNGEKFISIHQGD